MDATVPSPIVGKIEVFTYKTGLLSKVAHDLRLSLPAVTISQVGDRLDAHIPLTTFRVDGVMTRNGLQTHILSEGDRRRILDTLSSTILKTNRYPTACVSGTLTNNRFSGQLTLCGRTQAVNWMVTNSEDQFSGIVKIKPSNWGITPYRALLGAIQLQDRIEARFIFRR